jgi:GAF domain-containing protein
MVQPGRGFKDRIDSIADPELLEHERRSLQRLLVAARDPDRFREVAAKTAYILDRLKTLADEESEAEVDR